MSDNEIMVVNTGALFGVFNPCPFNGFMDNSMTWYEQRILDNFEWMDKDLAEKNQRYKQPVGYSVICNPELQKIFVYQRSSKDKEYPEKRLQGKWSCGIGGHIEKADYTFADPIYDSLTRELLEEVEIMGREKKPKVIGYINDDSNDVGKVHFGILYVVETDAEVARPRDPEIKQGGMISIDRFKARCSSSHFKVENWSKIALKPLLEYFENK